MKDVQKQRIYIDDWWNDRYDGYLANITLSGKTAKLNSDYTGDFKSEWYDVTPTTIDASQVTGDVNIYGSTGNDTIYFGKNYNGNSKFYYNKGYGNDTIYNILDNDEIHLENCETQSVSVSGNDVIITIKNTNETITLKNGTGKNIYISGQDWKTYSSTSSRVAEDIWFLEDEFDTCDLDSITEDKFSVTQIQPTEDKTFTQEDSLIAYSEQK